MTHRNSQSGFTMVEVLVALVVLAIGLLGIAALLPQQPAVRPHGDLSDPGRESCGRPRRPHPHEPDGPGRVRDAVCRRRSRGARLRDDRRLLRRRPRRRPICSNWKATVAQLLPNGEGQVVVTLPVALGEPATYVVTVRWAEVGEATPVTFQIGFQT